MMLFIFPVRDERTCCLSETYVTGLFTRLPYQGQGRLRLGGGGARTGGLVRRHLPQARLKESVSGGAPK